MRVVIVGAGAVGGLLGAMLSRAGTEVAFVARGATRSALRERGLTVTGPDGVLQTGPLQAEVEASLLGKADAVFVAVKSWQVREIAPELKPLVGPETVVVPLQNGVEAPEALRSALGSGPVAGGLCHVLSWQEGPGRIAFRGPAIAVTLGELDGGASPRLEKLAGSLRTAGATVTVAPDIRSSLWQKLLFVGPLGMVGAATRSTVERVRAVPESRALLEGAMREVQTVARACGVRVPDEAVAQALARIDGLPAGATASMHRDLEEGRPSELEEQVGAIVRLGAAHGVDVSVHRVLYGALKPRELAARKT